MSTGARSRFRSFNLATQSSDFSLKYAGRRLWPHCTPAFRCVGLLNLRQPSTRPSRPDYLGALHDVFESPDFRRLSSERVSRHRGYLLLRDVEKVANLTATTDFQSTADVKITDHDEMTENADSVGGTVCGETLVEDLVWDGEPSRDRRFV